MVAAHYRSHVEFSFEALDEAAAGFRRIEHFLDRAADVLGGVPTDGCCARTSSRRWTTTSALPPRSRRSTTWCARATSCSPGATPTRCAATGRLGRDARRARPRPVRPALARAAAGDEKLTEAVDALVGRAARAAREARADKDFAAADAIRDRIKAAGIELEDTPTAPSGALLTYRPPNMAGNSSAHGRDQEVRQGQPDRRVRRPGPPRARGQGPDPEGQGPAEATRPTRRKQRQEGRGRRRPPSRGVASGDAEWVAGRNSVVEALREGVPVTGLYVAEGAERDGRLREAFQLAADEGIPLLEVTRAELDRLTGGAVHQGLAAKIPAYEYAHPDDLLDRAAERRAAADRRARLGDRPAQPRRRSVRSAAGFGAHGVVIPERRAAGMTAAAWKTSAGRGPDPGRAGDQPDPAAQGLPGGRLHGGRPGRRRRRRPARPRPRRRAARLVVGSEGDGLSRLVAETCDQLVSIPMANHASRSTPASPRAWLSLRGRRAPG